MAATSPFISATSASPPNSIVPKSLCRPPPPPPRNAYSSELASPPERGTSPLHPKRRSGYKRTGIALLAGCSIFCIIFIPSWVARCHRRAADGSRTEALIEPHQDGTKLTPRNEAGTLPFYPMMDIGGPWIGHLEKRGALPLNSSEGGNGELPPVVCGDDRKGCDQAGRADICCPMDHNCQRTNNSLTGVFCCNHPSLPCSDRNLICPESTFSCDALHNGGCCPLGTVCTLDRCIPTSEISHYLAILDAAGLGTALSNKQPARKGVRWMTITEAKATQTELSIIRVTTTIPIRISEEVVREVEVIRDREVEVTRTTTETLYTNSPTAQPSAWLTAAPSPTKPIDLDGDGLSGTQDPTESILPTVLPTLSAGNSTIAESNSTETSTLESSSAPPATSTRKEKKKGNEPNVTLVSPGRTSIIKVLGEDITYTKVVPAVYMRMEDVLTKEPAVIARSSAQDIKRVGGNLGLVMAAAALVLGIIIAGVV